LIESLLQIPWMRYEDDRIVNREFCWFKREIEIIHKNLKFLKQNVMNCNLFQKDLIAELFVQ
jgi:hypothetical protein